MATTGVDEELAASVRRVADATAFSGVVRVDRAGEVVLALASGLADRAAGVANTLATRFGIASGTKGLTALAVVRLVEEGLLSLDTTARSVLGTDLPLVAEDVTVEHLLAHRSGIGDYLDEEDFDPREHVLPVPVHELATSEAYLALLDGRPPTSAAGERFSYNNAGYVLLAVLAERVAGRPFAELVGDEVCRRAGMGSTAFLRSDELPGDVARGYLGDGLRTNVLHLPVVGSGDGGISTTVADVHRFWDAFVAGRIVSEEHVAAMTRPRSDAPAEGRRYGLGFWLHPTRDGVLQLEGYDAGVSFRSVHDRSGALTWTVVSNTSEGAWPLARHLGQTLG